MEVCQLSRTGNFGEKFPAFMGGFYCDNTLQIIVFHDRSLQAMLNHDKHGQKLWFIITVHDRQWCIMLRFSLVCPVKIGMTVSEVESYYSKYDIWHIKNRCSHSLLDPSYYQSFLGSQCITQLYNNEAIKMHVRKLVPVQSYSCRNDWKAQSCSCYCVERPANTASRSQEML